MPGIHALDNITVNDILVPRSEVDGINLDDSIEEIIEQLRISPRTRLPVFHSDINQVEAVLNTRQIQHLLPDASLTKEALLAACHEPYFVPESTPLQLQLLNFHKQQRRLGMVVDEYGEVLGIVTLEDILEEIVGEFESEQAGQPAYRSAARWPLHHRRRRFDPRTEQEPGLAPAQRRPQDPQRPGDRSAGDHSGLRGVPEDRPLPPGNPRDRGQPREQGADLAHQSSAGGRLNPPCSIRNPLPIIGSAYPSPARPRAIRTERVQAPQHPV